MADRPPQRSRVCPGSVAVGDPGRQKGLQAPGIRTQVRVRCRTGSGNAPRRAGLPEGDAGIWSIRRRGPCSDRRQVSMRLSDRAAVGGCSDDRHSARSAVRASSARRSTRRRRASAGERRRPHTGDFHRPGALRLGFQAGWNCDRLNCHVGVLKTSHRHAQAAVEPFGIARQKFIEDGADRRDAHRIGLQVAERSCARSRRDLASSS